MVGVVARDGDDYAGAHMHAGRRLRWLESLFSSRLWTIAGLTALLLLASAPAEAQGDVGRAAVLAREAEDLLAAGKTAEACDKYAESLSLDRRGGTALDLAVCREKQGRFGQAYRAYGVAAELAKKEKRQDRERSAKAGRNRLLFKLSKITVKPPAKPPAGMTITVNGDTLPPDKYNKPWEAGPGSVVIVASAPGHAPWEQTVKLLQRQTRTVVVGTLKPGAAPAPVPGPVSKPGGAPVPGPVPPGPAPPPPEPTPERTDDEGGRIVVEVGVMGGLMIHTIDRANVTELDGVDYQFRTSPNGLTIGTCGNFTSVQGAGECDALFGTSAGAMVGGELFVGWAIVPRFHLGVRGFGAKRFKDGWMFLGGPGFSVRAVGPIWLGASFLVGATEHDAEITGAEGTVPEEFRDINGGLTHVPIDLATVGATEAIVPSGLLFGGTVEISFAIVGPSPNAAATTDLPTDFLAGSLMLSVWPSVLVAPNGLSINVPGGLAYRFH